MSAERIIYRTRQFWHALGSRPSPEEMALVEALLTAPQKTVFTRMQKSEQAHGLLVLQTLLDSGENDKDLSVAALLHDVGKSRFPLHLWERVEIVLVRKICPAYVKRWGETGTGKSQVPHGWRRAFIIAERHPAWGAEIAAEVGCSQLTTNLIRRHQEQLSVSECDGMEDRLLLKLQAADNES